MAPDITPSQHLQPDISTPTTSRPGVDLAPTPGDGAHAPPPYPAGSHGSRRARKSRITPDLPLPISASRGRLPWSIGFSAQLHEVSLPFAATVLQFGRLGEKGSYLLNPRAPGMVLDMDGYVDPYEEVVAEDDSDNPDEDDSDAESNYKDKSVDLLKSDKHRVRNPDDTFRGPFCPCKKSRGTRARTSSSTLPTSMSPTSINITAANVEVM
ncbi:hypothetical protein Zm00014a_032905 [Zea mays]|uniref:Uncharacterized protein n=1 Tax=Zea mays TaxID=4577 RepID=A0A317YIA0_MAIZE|nr:hypothetical protein Zm00014a_032905 [Zea mays]